MTAKPHMNMPSEIYDARKALGGYLQRTDLLLARSGLSRSERDETLGQIAEQFYDLLGVPIREADQEQAESAIARLAPETAFELNEATSLGQQLRAAWQRCRIGGIVPIFLNDRGRKRVVWGELIKVLVWMSLFIATLFTVLSMMMFGCPDWRWAINGFMFGSLQMGIWFGFYWMYPRDPGSPGVVGAI